MIRTLLTLAIISLASAAIAQRKNEKERLDFAEAYFEIGTNYLPSFSGKQLLNNEINAIQHSASMNSSIYWGAFHFWGHAEFYVSFPFHQLSFSSNESINTIFTHSNVTGMRYYPWAIKDKKLRPYIGLSWGAFDFKQIIQPDDNHPLLQKNFELVADAGMLYRHGAFGLRLGINYLKNNDWHYPLSPTRFEEIKTPNLRFQIGLLYITDFSKQNKDPESNERWNSFPRVSNINFNASSKGDLFLAAGTSLSFTLKAAAYNNSNYPYFNKKQSSDSYFDFAIGYQFNNLSAFTAFTFRNPTFLRSGFETEQSIKKTSFALEGVKFLTDYSGFAPFIGLNVAYDKIDYTERTTTGDKNHTFNKLEPGLTFGWDIVPGKSEEFLILRTNLRWYPFSKFEIDGLDFNFNQLEYNLIQAVFYPGRFLKSRK